MVPYLVRVFNGEICLKAASTVVKFDVQVCVAKYVLIVAKHLVTHHRAKTGFIVFNIFCRPH